MPYQPYTGQRVADLSPLQQAGISGYGQLAGQMAPLYGQGAGTLGNILQGAQNPYEQNMIDRATRDTTNAYNQAVAGTSGRFNSPGNWDSARHDMRDELNQRALATGLGDSIGGIEANQFNTNNQMALQGVGALNSTLGAQTGALNSAINAGGVQQGQLQNVYNTAYNDFTQQRDYPWTQLNRFGGLLGSITGAAPRTTTNVQGYDPVSQGLGLATLGNSKGGNSGGKQGGATDLSQLNGMGNMGPGTYG
jgi:hypothetical protein